MGAGSTAGDVLRLQRAAGNRAVGSWVQRQALAARGTPGVNAGEAVDVAGLLSQAADADRQAAVDRLGWLNTVRPVPGQPGMHSATLEGHAVMLDDAQLAAAHVRLQKAFAAALTRVKGKARIAREAYVDRIKEAEDQPLVASVVYGWAQLRSGFRFYDVLTEFPQRYTEAAVWAATAEQMLAARDYPGAADALARAEAAAERSHQLEHAYFEQVVGASEASVTALQCTRTVSFVALAVLGTIATGGVAAGVISGTTTVGGVVVGTAATATALSTAAPIAATLGEAAMKQGLDMHVDWTKVGVDVAFDLVASRIPGGKMGGWLARGLYRPLLAAAPAAAKSALLRVGVLGLARILENWLVTQGVTLLKWAIDKAYAAGHGDDRVTWDHFGSQVAARLLEQLRDPTGWAMSAVMGAVTAAAEVKFVSGPSIPGLTQPSATTGAHGAKEEPPKPPMEPLAAGGEPQPKPPVVPLAAGGEPQPKPPVEPLAVVQQQLPKPPSAPKFLSKDELLPPKPAPASPSDAPAPKPASAPAQTNIGGARVRSWSPTVFVGTSRSQFRRAVERILAANPQHPLRKLLGPNKRLRSTTAKGIGEREWLEDPRLVEAGHVASKKGEGPEQLILMSAYKNRLLSARVEHPSFGAHAEGPREALNIGGIAVDPDLACDLVNAGVIGADVVKSAQWITF